MSLVFLSSCSKDSSTTNNAAASDPLTSKSWSPTIQTTSSSSLHLTCHEDDKYKFQTDGIVQVTSTVPCFTGQVGNWTQTYTLAADKKSMIYRIYGNDIDFDIITLNETVLEMEGYVVGSTTKYYYVKYVAK